MADITIIRNGARISLASFPKLGSGSENIAVAVSTSGAYDTYTTELYYGWYQGSSMQKALAKYQNGLYYIPSNALFNAGNVYLTLRLVSGDSKVSTNTIPITIEKSAVNNEYSILPASETWQNAVDNYINNSINLLNERIDNLEVDGRNIENEITTVNTKVGNHLTTATKLLDFHANAGVQKVFTGEDYKMIYLVITMVSSASGDTYADNSRIGTTVMIPNYFRDISVPFNFNFENSSGTQIRTNGKITTGTITIDGVTNTVSGYMHFEVYGIN